MNIKSAGGSPPTLVIFCRRPAPGHGKSRIAAAIGPELAFELTRHLLETALEDAADWPGPVCIAPANRVDRNWAETLLNGYHCVCPQPEGNLGERLNAVDRANRSAGAQRLIFIGSDAPLLDAHYYEQARAALDTHDVVLGAAEDGGVVLMGARRAWPDLARLPWSGNNLGNQLELHCIRHGLTVKCLPTRYDIDFDHDLLRLHADLLDDQRPARQALYDWLTAAGFTPDRVN